MFRGVSALESEVTEPADFDAVSDEIRRWSSLSENECQCFVSADDGVLNEFEMMHMTLRILFPLHFVVFKQTVCQVCVTWQLRPMWNKFSQRAGQLSEVNLDRDSS
jgi:hypothetical protein